MKLLKNINTLLLLTILGDVNTAKIYEENITDRIKIDMLVSIVSDNLKTCGWYNLLFIGCLPDFFYNRIQHLPLTICNSDTYSDIHDIEDVTPYDSNILIINCLDFEELEKSLKKALNLPYWHPLSNIIVYYKSASDRLVLAKIYYTLWYYQALNVIIIQDNDSANIMSITYFSPYISDEYKLDYEYGCYTARRVGMPINTFSTDFVCEQGCSNVSIYTKLRARHLGTCIGLTTYHVNYGDQESLNKLILFDDKTKDMHGFVMRAFIIEVRPFLKIKENSDGSYTIYERDGLIWSTMAELMNFKIDLSPAKDVMNKHFNYDKIVQQIFEFVERKTDLFLLPVYQFDLVLAKVGNTFPFMESGVCFLSYRADFETLLLDLKLLQNNYLIITEFLLCFVCAWFVFYIYSPQRNRRLMFDQIGKDFLNVCRMVLSTSLHNPPQRTLFRCFLAICIWSFFIMNFSTQAHIIALFSSFKRGKNVDTYNDILEKGYPIHGIGSPDVVLPDDEDIYRKINAKVEFTEDIFECIHNIQDNSKLFCLIDCALGRYLELNLLNNKGEQFLHVGRQDRIHSLYLNMILREQSPFLEHYNRIMLALFEGGIIRKWMQYRYKIVGEDVPFKVLNMEDLKGIFQCYCMLLALSLFIFLIEVALGNYRKMKRTTKHILLKWKTYLCRKVTSPFIKKGRHEIETQTDLDDKTI